MTDNKTTAQAADQNSASADDRTASAGQTAGAGSTVKVTGSTADSTVVCTNGTSLTKAATDVLQGVYGNNPRRQNELTAAGCDYQTIQTYVNQLVETGQAAWNVGITSENTEVEIHLDENSTTKITPVEETDDPEEEDADAEETDAEETTEVISPAPAATEENTVSLVVVVLIIVVVLAAVVAAAALIAKKYLKKPAEKPKLNVRPLTFDRKTRTFHIRTPEEQAEIDAKRRHDAAVAAELAKEQQTSQAAQPAGNAPADPQSQPGTPDQPVPGQPAGPQPEK